MSDGQISLWLPEQDRIRLAVLGKLIEECNELSARAARCIIQGLDSFDPDSGHPNFGELGREAADVVACIQTATRVLDIRPSVARIEKKAGGYERWHQLIRDAEAGVPT